MEMADRMAEDGFKDAGYEYVSIDVGCLHLMLISIESLLLQTFLAIFPPLDTCTSLNAAKLLFLGLLGLP